MLVELLVEQVEFADVIVMNKIDRATAEERGRLRALLASLNPAASIVEASHGRVPLGTVLDTGRFDLARASQGPGWAQALAGHHVPESEAFGIRSFVWRARRPLHPARFKAFIEGDLPGVVRAKGLFWLATRMPWAGAWQLAGAVGRHEAAGFWWAAVPPERWPDDPAWSDRIRALWDERFGDRRQELVFIGIDMDEGALREALDACLLADREYARGPRGWASLPDPFPPWREG